MSIPTPDFLTCPICRTRFNGTNKKPISLLCGHTCCSSCLQLMHRKQCPLDAAPFQQEDIDSFPTNQALLLLVAENRTEEGTKTLQNGDSCTNTEVRQIVEQCIGELALYLKPLSSTNQKSGNNSITLSRPMQRKLVALVHCQLAEPVGRARALRAARSLGERTCTELILQHQNQQQLSSMLWAAVRTRGCQFLGPAMQEAALKYILLSLEQGEALSRKVLVLYVVQQLEPHFPQASKTSIGHVVQLLYRASCFKVAKRNDDSSLMQLKEEYRTYEALRREHDAQIVNMAQEAGIRIPPDQWSQLLYGDTAHKSHMQSIIDRLQTPASFTHSIQELMIALSRSEDTHNLSALKTDFNILAKINPATEDSSVTWGDLNEALLSLRNVVRGLERFLQTKAKTKGLTEHAHTVGCVHENCNAHGKYKTTMCRDLLLPQSCPRGASCTFAHTQEEMERYRNQKKNMKHMSELDQSSVCTAAMNMNGGCDDRDKLYMSNNSPCSQALPTSIPSSQHKSIVSQSGMLPPPPQPHFPPQNGVLPQTNGHIPQQHWNGLPTDPRLATPRLPSSYTIPSTTQNNRQFDQERAQLLQLHQQLLQGGTTPLLPHSAPPPITTMPRTSLHDLNNDHVINSAGRDSHPHFVSAPTHTGQGGHTNGVNGSNGLIGNDYLNMLELQRLQQQHNQQPVHPASIQQNTDSQIPLWEQHKLSNMQNAVSSAVQAPISATPNHSLWGHYDAATPAPPRLDSNDALRQEILRQYLQGSNATAPTPTSNGLHSSLLNHNTLAAQQGSPSPALSSYTNYLPTSQSNQASNLLVSRLNQLKLQEQIQNERAAAQQALQHQLSDHSNSFANYSHLLPQQNSASAQQLKYDMLAKADHGQAQSLLKYEQLLNSHQQIGANGLSNNVLSNNGLSNNGLLSHLQNSTTNGLHQDYTKSTSVSSAISSQNTDVYNGSSIWQSQQQPDNWHLPTQNRASSRPTDGVENSIHQLLQHYDRNLALQLQLDDVE